MSDLNLPRHIIERFERRWALQRIRDGLHGRTDVVNFGLDDEHREDIGLPPRPHPGATSWSPSLAP
jgi:hypothetical protein